MEAKNMLSTEQCEDLIRVLKARFEKNMICHEGSAWSELQTRLEKPAGAEKLWSLSEM